MYFFNKMFTRDKGVLNSVSHFRSLVIKFTYARHTVNIKEVNV